MLLTTLIFIVTLILIGINTILYISIKRIKLENNEPDTTINISIVIALRNEEKNLERLFQSLDNLDYPNDKYEIVFVDDNSDDNTYLILADYCEEYPNKNVISANEKELAGKKGALTIGINASKFEHIFITDADCIVSPKILQIYSANFKSGEKIVFGKTAFIQEKNFLNNHICYENFRAFFLKFSIGTLLSPYSASGANIGFEKAIWKELGGYSKMQQTLSGDDDYLLREAANKGIKVKPILSDDALVFTWTKNSFNEYLHQKSRHTSTSHYYLFKHQAILAFWHLLNLLPIIFVPLSYFSILFLFPFGIKLFCDLVIAKKLSYQLKYKFSNTLILKSQLLYEILIVRNYFSSFYYKNKW